jgi:hypothetical protein
MLTFRFVPTNGHPSSSRYCGCSGSRTVLMCERAARLLIPQSWTKSVHFKNGREMPKAGVIKVLFAAQSANPTALNSALNGLKVT